MNPVILIAEDDADIRRLLRLYLEGEGFRVLEADNGATALALARERTPDMAILDVMMPEMNGFELTRALRRYSNVPILILSARSQDNDKILGLNLGADDYIAKPFNPVEIVARVKAQLRRAPEPVTEKELVFEDIRMDLVEKKVFRGENFVHLGPTEFRLLRTLMDMPGKVFSRDFLLKTVWGDNIYVESRTIDVHIRRLRQALNKYGPDYIRTVRATGYALDSSLKEEI